MIWTTASRLRRTFQQYVCIIVLVWEERWNNPESSVIKAAEDLPNELLGVCTTTSTSLATELCLGIFWPIAVYTKWVGADPPRKQIKKVQHNGAMVRGVIREPCHGQPIGCIKLTQRCMVTHEEETEHDSTKDAVRGNEQVRETFAALQRASSVQLALPSEAVPFGGIKMRHQPPPDDDLDLVWNSPFAATRAASKKDGSQRGIGLPPRSVSKSDTDSAARPVASTARSPSNRKQHELNSSEQCALKAKQTWQALQSEGFASVTPQKLKALLAQMQSRLKDNLVMTYMEDESSGNAGGIQILEDLRNYHEKLSSYEELVTCIHQPTGVGQQVSQEYSLVESLLKVMSDIADRGIPVAKKCVIVVWNKICNTLANAEQFDQWAQTLFRVHPNAALPARFYTMLDESEKQAFYQEHLMTVIISALQVSGKEEFVRAALQSVLPSAETHLQKVSFQARHP